jgi:hypothetical protein
MAMKKLIFILVVLSTQYIYANMASPIIPGTMTATPFTSQYIDILGEKIFIRINKNHTTAKFQIEYRISSSANGLQIPLLFYAVDYNKDFKVWIDGKELQIKKLPKELQLKDSILLSDFHYLFSTTAKENAENRTIKVKDKPGVNFYVNVYDLLFFETNITEGKHIIKVEYEAFSEIDGSGWVNSYSYSYSLSPAKYWKSFGGLELIIDASACDKTFTCNMGRPSNGSVDSIASWKFAKFPDEELILLRYEPKISTFAQTLINLSPEGIAIIFGLLFIGLHLALIVNYRKKNLSARFSKPMIIGSLLVPLLYLIINYYSYFLIDNFIDDASGNHGYLFLILFFYPFLLPFYWLFMWLVDRIYKRSKIRKQSS